MNAEEYVRQKAFSGGYLGGFSYREADQRMVAKEDHNFDFLRGVTLSEAEFDDAQEGVLFQDEVRVCAAKLEAGLKHGIYPFLAPFGLLTSSFEVEIVFDTVTCDIVLTHRKGRGVITLREVYFSKVGEILQATLSFQ